MTSAPANLTVTLVDGTQVVVPNSLEQITPYVLQEQGDWFEDEIKFLRRLVQPGQTVIDIGANLGVYALCLARKVGPSGQVWAFKPTSETTVLLEASIAVNCTPWLHHERQALDDIGTSLDACLDAFDWHQVDLLNINAEGAEERILAGGRRFFSDLSPLVMFKLKPGTELHLELLERFQDLGYACFRLAPGLDALIPFDPTAGVDGYLLNLFAAKPDRANALAASGWLVPTGCPPPPDPVELENYHWRRMLSQLPYSQSLSAGWEEQEGNNADAAEALALWAYAQDSAQPIAQRLGALLSSYYLLNEQARDKQRLTSLSSLVRVAAALGERTSALRALGHLIPGLATATGSRPFFKEPFIPPCSRFDGLDPQGRLSEWLEAAALEGDELLGHFSTYFSGIKGRPRLERLNALGIPGTAMQQRLNLLNRRYPPRKPASPEMQRDNPEQITRSQQAFDLIHAGEIEQGQQLLAQAELMGETCSLALHLMARCRSALGDRQMAAETLQRAVELDPTNAAALLELGVCLKSVGDPAAAVAVIQQVIWLYGFRMASEEPTAGDFNNLAIAFQELGDADQSLTYLDRALELEPDSHASLYQKALLLHYQLRHYDAALAIWEQLQASKPKDPQLMAQRAIIQIYYGEITEATILLEEAISLGSNLSVAHYPLAFAHSVAGKEAMAEHLRHLRGFWKEFRSCPESHETPTLRLHIPNAKDRVRVAFLSAELGEHVVSRFLEPFLKYYDRDRFEVELIEVIDHCSERASELSKMADAVVSVKGLSLKEARERVIRRNYSIIIETSGFTNNSGLEILASRCAPVQCHYIGFHASTGLDTIDWFIGDDLIAGEDLADQFEEELWRLPRVWLACRRPSSLPDSGSNRQGLPPVLGSFNQFSKVGVETIRYWAAALKRIPEAKLHLKNFLTDSPRPRQRILEALTSLGIDSGRVMFLPRTETEQEHLACYRDIDVALDTTPWAGATTTVDALVMGVPVVGILGSTTASRMTSSILRAIGREPWIASTPESFADAAAMLLQDPDALRDGRAKLRQAVLDSPLFDGADLAHHLQEAFRAMLARRARTKHSSETFQPTLC